MTTGYKPGKADPEKLMTLEEPDKPLLFDASPWMVEEVSARCNIEAFVEGLRGKGEEDVRAAFESFGKELMRVTIELADGKYIDRTGEMVEKVAKQTGISFPHRFERYVELSILSSRPLDRWTILKATTKELGLQVSSCSVHKMIQEGGAEHKEPPCARMCLASFEIAAQKTGDSLSMEMRKVLPRDGICKFLFRLVSA